MADSTDLVRLLQAKHEALRAYREAQDDDTRAKAWDTVDQAGKALDTALVEREEARKLDEQMAAEETRVAAAKKAAEVEGKKYVGLPIEDIRAYARGERGPVSMNLEFRTDFTTTDAATIYSSYLVPQTWADSVINFQIASSGLLQAGPTIITTQGGNQINMPKLVTDATSLAGTEGSAATVSNVVFGTVALNAYRFDGFFAVSNELIDDSGTALEPLLRQYAARSISAKINPYFSDPDIGTGSSTIAAVQVNCTSALTAASQTAVSLDELKQLYYSVLPVYRANGKWVANSALTLFVAQAKDDNNNYVWQPQLAAGEADRFMGKPWFEDAYMDTLATGNEPVIFGDIAAGYTVRYAHGGMQFIASKEFSVTSFETTFVWGIWVDADATDPLAIKSITLA